MFGVKKEIDLDEARHQVEIETMRGELLAKYSQEYFAACEKDFEDLATFFAEAMSGGKSVDDAIINKLTQEEPDVAYEKCVAKSERARNMSESDLRQEYAREFNRWKPINSCL